MQASSEMLGCTCLPAWTWGLAMDVPHITSSAPASRTQGSEFRQWCYGLSTWKQDQNPKVKFISLDYQARAT